MSRARLGGALPAAGFGRGPPPPPAWTEALKAAATTGKLQLSDRGLTAVPMSLLLSAAASVDNWWALEPLTSIDLSFNALTGVDAELGEVCADTLVNLRLDSNAITSDGLPSSFWRLAALKSLSLSRNALTSLPYEAFALMGGLVSLDLSGNRLTTPSFDLSPLVALEALNLADNGLQHLPDSVAACGRLLTLDVSGNALDRLPEGLRACSRLQTLRVARNRLASLPEALAYLSSLLVLDARQNAISRWPPALPPALQELYLDRNRLRAIEPPSAAACPSLSVLTLSENALASLPDELRLCVKLSTLDLRNNDLPSLPAWIGFLPLLVRLSVEANPLRGVKRLLIEPGAPAGPLKAYLRTRASEAEARRWEWELTEGGGGGSGGGGGAARRGGGGAAPLSSAAPAAFTPSVPPEWELGAFTGGGSSAWPRHLVEALEAAWVGATRDAASPHARLVLQPSTFPAPLQRLAVERLDGGQLALLPRLRALVADGHRLHPEDGLPSDLLLVCPALEEVSLANNGLLAVPPALSAWTPTAGGGALPAALTRLPRPPAAPLPRFAALRSLNLSGNRLEADRLGAALPPSLEFLDLSHNLLTSFPPALRRLPSLHTLLLQENAIALPAAEPGLGSLRSREDDALYLPSLRVLSLAQNKLARIPSSVLALRSLQSLDLSFNEIGAVPPHLGLLKSLGALNLDGNPQRGVRRAIADRGVAAVLAFLESRVPPGTEGVFFAAYEGEGKGGGGGSSGGVVMAGPRGGAGAAAPPLPRSAASGYSAPLLDPSRLAHEATTGSPFYAPEGSSASQRGAVEPAPLPPGFGYTVPPPARFASLGLGNGTPYGPPSSSTSAAAPVAGVAPVYSGGFETGYAAPPPRPLLAPRTAQPAAQPFYQHQQPQAPSQQQHRAAPPAPPSFRPSYDDDNGDDRRWREDGSGWGRTSTAAAGDGRGAGGWGSHGSWTEAAPVPAPRPDITGGRRPAYRFEEDEEDGDGRTQRHHAPPPHARPPSSPGSPASGPGSPDYRPRPPSAWRAARPASAPAFPPAPSAPLEAADDDDAFIPGAPLPTTLGGVRGAIERLEAQLGGGGGSGLSQPLRAAMKRRLTVLRAREAELVGW